MQPYFFPYLGYFQLLHSVDRFVSYDDVSFIKQGWINRNRILINGRATFITVPVRDRSSFRLIRDVEIDGRIDAPWRRKLLKSIDIAYRRAPCFDRVFPVIETVLTVRTTSISALALASVVEMSRYLGLQTHIEPSSSVYGNAHLHGPGRVLAICRAEGADEYVNPVGGLHLYAAADFAAVGVRLRFLRSTAVPYTQFGADAVPSLSIIDVAMFNTPDALRESLTQYELQ